MKIDPIALQPEIAELLANTPKTSQKTLDRLAAANRKLENDPEFLADVERSRFINSILTAMYEKQISRSELARGIGKSRQYVQKVFDEDARASFTLKTMVSLCHALGKRLEIKISDRENA